MLRVYKDKTSNLWYWQINGIKSEPIFKNKKQAWAKGNIFMNLDKGEYK
jgi:hypothetical protein